jgi:hypothetical protein
MQTGIEVEVVWWDQDVIKYRFACCNGRFSGQAEIYLNHSEVAKIADALRGFPSRADDSRNFELGTFDSQCAGGGVKLHFYCLDSVGHAAVEVSLRCDGCKGLGDVESVALRIPLGSCGNRQLCGRHRKAGPKDSLQGAVTNGGLRGPNLDAKIED